MPKPASELFRQRDREQQTAGRHPLAEAFNLPGLQDIDLEARPLQYPPVPVQENVVDAEPVALDDSVDNGFATVGIDPVAEARARHAGAGAALEMEPEPAEDAVTSLLPKIKLAGIVAALIAGALALRFLSPGASSASSPATATAQVSAPKAAAGPGVVMTPATTDTPLPGGTEIYLTDSPAMQITADAFETEITQLANVWPASLQTCDAKGLTGYDRSICVAVGQETYFRCAPDGRNYMISATCVYPG